MFELIISNERTIKTFYTKTCTHPTYVSTIKSSSSRVIHWCVCPVKRPYVKVTLNDKLTGSYKHCTHESLRWLLN
jgi:hypothetical protein